MDEFNFTFTSGMPINCSTSWVFNLDHKGNIINEEEARKEMEFSKFMENLGMKENQ